MHNEYFCITEINNCRVKIDVFGKRDYRLGLKTQSFKTNSMVQHETRATMQV